MGSLLAILSLMFAYICIMVVWLGCDVGRYIGVWRLCVCHMVICGVFLGWLDTLGLAYWPFVGCICAVLGYRL